MDEQMKTPLYDALKTHDERVPVSFHVPGHKYGSVYPGKAKADFEALLRLDATELTGLDDLHSPEGAILEAETLLADLYQVKKSFFLINGSTVGNLAMIMAAVSENDIVVVQRNCHKSVLNALKLAKVRPIFLEPEYEPSWKIPNGISIESIKQAVSLYPDIKTIILTYPNYYGMVYDIQSIIEFAHLHRIPVLVDEAHGPHFILGDPFPPSAVQFGADIVVQSAHKTLPAMTMGSFLHFNSSLLKQEKVTEYLSIFQSSSPSYPIMASLDLARDYLAHYRQEDMKFLHTEIAQFKTYLREIPAIKVLDYPNEQGDLLKITIQTRCNLSGFEIQKKLEAEGIFIELADPNNVLFILPLMKVGFQGKLKEIAIKIKEVFAGLQVIGQRPIQYAGTREITELVVPYDKMVQLEEAEIPLEDAEGFTCSEAIIPYPPGIPLLLRGERITKERLRQLLSLIEQKARFQGTDFLYKGRIKVFKTAEYRQI